MGVSKTNRNKQAKRQIIKILAAAVFIGLTSQDSQYLLAQTTSNQTTSSNQTINVVNTATGVYSDPITNQPIAIKSNQVITSNAIPIQAFAAIFLTNTRTDPNNTPNIINDDVITYNLSLQVNATAPQNASTYTVQDLAGTSLTINGAAVKGILVSDVVPTRTTLINPATAPTGWIAIYSADNTSVLNAVTDWNTNPKAFNSSIANVKRVGFYKIGSQTKGTSVKGFSFQVRTTGIDSTNNRVYNIAQLLGTTNNPTNSNIVGPIVYDESGDQRPSNFNDNGTPGNTVPTNGVANPTNHQIDNNNNNTGTGNGGQDNQVVIDVRLVDPLGRVTGCEGEILPDYNGFTVGLYETDNGLDFTSVTKLTPTELPDIPGNGIPKGVSPNTQNSNPFFLTNTDQGKYSFLLDRNRGQLTQGKKYILVVNAPPNNNYNQRRILLTIGATTIINNTEENVAYNATSLDGQPLSAFTNDSSTTGEITINVQNVDIANAETGGLSLAVLKLNSSVCKASQISITKTGDRAAAEPGDTVIYRLAIKNFTASDIENLQITDTLPLGFKFVANSARASYNNTSIPITSNNNGSTVTFTTPFVLPKVPQTSSITGIDPLPTINIVYAAVITPDAVRGTAQNSALVNGHMVTPSRSNPAGDVKDGPALYKLGINPGILSDCGTIIGRVFVDKNFDGEQQDNEPGIPNAVIYLDDGNRIITDANGLFSVQNVVSGYRTGVLDLTSLPGYALAPNLHIKERNSQSRLVHLQPGGLVRMNFAVTPTFREGEQK